MNNVALAKRIKDFRISKAYSQEQLANITGLSLRTIQRIENGETEPRGDTLSRLANAFSVTPNDLIEWTEIEDNGFLFVMNISAFSFILFPILGVIIPLVLWILKKDKIKNVDAIGKKILNFEITFCVFVFLWYLFGFLTMIFGLPRSLPRFQFMNLGTTELLLFIPLVFYIYIFILVAINSVKSYNKGKVSYFPAIRFLK